MAPKVLVLLIVLAAFLSLVGVGGITFVALMTFDGLVHFFALVSVVLAAYLAIDFVCNHWK